ncbi:MAG: endolytic transglycosylase MltG [Lachnospiraceae bacterium]|nr:endolytic transglycosylase MltG [Lachnospiraceae bacterium]
MKLRYYMRGLGIGILVTAILMSVTLDGKTEKLTDAEIIERAKALGMEEKYETTVLSETVSENEAEKAKEEELQQESEAAEEEPEEMQEIVTDEPETVQITVQGGDGSMTVSRKLKDAGMIDDVVAYDKFLCNNGYDKKICTGTHTIPVNATEEQIAQIITSRAR